MSSRLCFLCTLIYKLPLYICYYTVIVLFSVCWWTIKFIFVRYPKTVTRIRATMSRLWYIIKNWACCCWNGFIPNIEQDEEKAEEAPTTSCPRVDTTVSEGKKAIVKYPNGEPVDEIDKEELREELRREAEKQRREIEIMENEAFRDIARGERLLKERMNNLLENCPQRKAFKNMMDEPD